MQKDKAMVLFSGGQDSTTCLFWAKTQFKEVYAVIFDYGQRHRVEVEAARKIAEEAKIKYRVLQLDVISQITNNSLTSEDLEIEKEKPDDRAPNTLVEGRNMLFLTYAAILAKSMDIHHLVTGVGQADYSGYPDCRNDFIISLNATLNLSMEYNYTIHTPLMWKNKAEIWEMSDELGVFELVKNETITCYRGISGDGCGECPACHLRRRGLSDYAQKRNKVSTKR